MEARLNIYALRHPDDCILGDQRSSEDSDNPHDLNTWHIDHTGHTDAVCSFRFPVFNPGNLQYLPDTDETRRTCGNPLFAGGALILSRDGEADEPFHLRDLKLAITPSDQSNDPSADLGIITLSALGLLTGNGWRRERVSCLITVPVKSVLRHVAGEMLARLKKDYPEIYGLHLPPLKAVFGVQGKMKAGIAMKVVQELRGLVELQRKAERHARESKGEGGLFGRNDEPRVHYDANGRYCQEKKITQYGTAIGQREDCDPEMPTADDERLHYHLELIPWSTWGGEATCQFGQGRGPDPIIVHRRLVTLETLIDLDTLRRDGDKRVAVTLLNISDHNPRWSKGFVAHGMADPPLTTAKLPSSGNPQFPDWQVKLSSKSERIEQNKSGQSRQIPPKRIFQAKYLEESRPYVYHRVKVDFNEKQVVEGIFLEGERIVIATVSLETPTLNRQSMPVCGS